jgi:hypothetical protein
MEKAFCKKALHRRREGRRNTLPPRPQSTPVGLDAAPPMRGFPGVFRISLVATAVETKQDVLLDLAVQPLVIHDEQISSRTVGLRANEPNRRSCVTIMAEAGRALQPLFSIICG